MIPINAEVTLALITQLYGEALGASKRVEELEREIKELKAQLNGHKDEHQPAPMPKR